jgi:hypothetical protein
MILTNGQASLIKIQKTSILSQVFELQRFIFPQIFQDICKIPFRIHFPAFQYHNMNLHKYQ